MIKTLHKLSLGMALGLALAVAWQPTSRAEQATTNTTNTTDTLAALPAAAADARAAQQLVDRARRTFVEVMAESNFELARNLMNEASGVLIVPNLVKAGFFLGGETGSGVLLARGPQGNWSDPAFYTLAAGSLGLQFGVKDSRVVFIIRTPGALQAVLDDQVKLGSDVSVAMGLAGASLAGATTTNMGADMVAFALSRGVFGGGSLGGALIARRDAYNTAYYGQELLPRDIVANAHMANQEVQELKAVLARY